MFLRLLLIVMLFSSTEAWAVTQWAKTKPATGDNLTSWPTDNQANLSILDTLLSNYRQGMAVTYSSATTLAITAGEVVASNSGGTVRLFLQNAASVNATASNLDTGSSFSNSTTYYVYAGATSATAAAATIYLSLSSSAPSGITYYKRLGYFTSDGSGNVSATAIINDDNPLSATLQNSIMYINNNVNLGTKTISNGFLGQTTTATVTQSNNSDNYCTTGCYVRGMHRDSDGSAGSLYCACP